MRQCLRLVLKVKPFKIFTAIHNSINLVGSEGIHFNQQPFFDCLLEFTLIKRLLFYHLTHTSVYQSLLVKLLLPCSCILEIAQSNPFTDKYHSNRTDLLNNLSTHPLAIIIIRWFFEKILSLTHIFHQELTNHSSCCTNYVKNIAGNTCIWYYRLLFDAQRIFKCFLLSFNRSLRRS